MVERNRNPFPNPLKNQNKQNNTQILAVFASKPNCTFSAERSLGPSFLQGSEEQRANLTSMDAALCLALALWISSMNEVCTAEPLAGSCGEGGTDAEGRVEAASWVPAGGLAVGRCWAGFIRAEDSWEGCMTTGELCAWRTVSGTTSDFTSPGTPALPCRDVPGACGGSSWLRRTSAAVAFSIATYWAAWAGSAPFKSPSVTCLREKQCVNVEHLMILSFHTVSKVTSNLTAKDPNLLCFGGWGLCDALSLFIHKTVGETWPWRLNLGEHGSTSYECPVCVCVWGGGGLMALACVNILGKSWFYHVQIWRGGMLHRKDAI